MRKLFKGVLVFFGVLFMLGACMVIVSDDEAAETPVQETKSEPAEEVAAEEVKEEDPVEEEPAEEPKEEEPEMSVSQKNAVKAAENYISIMPFSESGLVKQLEFEGYSNEDAVLALENISVDWREQAVRHAKNYIDTMPMSRQGLIQQLEFEGHSTEDAEYAATEVGL